jgi:CRP-like cAMP-binding protein
MSAAPGFIDPVLPPRGGVAFKAWLRRLVTDAAQLKAFDAGEIDAVMDRDSGCAHLLPEAQSAQRDSNHIALGALEALPGEVCVLDATGVVVMVNKAWRIAGARHSCVGLDVRAGDSLFAACRDSPQSERVHADSVAAGLRQVLAGVRLDFSVRYACPSPRGANVCTLTIAATSATGPVNALLTRAWESEPEQIAATVRTSRKPRGLTADVRAGAENRLLAALPAKVHARLEADLESVALTYGEVLYEPGERMRHVYFPDSCLVSLLTLVEGHRAIEVGLVGNEGMVGARLALGVHTSSVRALVQGSGTALRMNAGHFLGALHRSRALRRVLMQFTDELMIQVNQTAACNRFHLVESRVARWLLMTSDRMRSATFHLTHSFIAEMLGVRREGVTVAALALQGRGIIRYVRGNITVLDHQGLEAASCSCYRHLKLAGSSR